MDTEGARMPKTYRRRGRGSETPTAQRSAAARGDRCAADGCDGREGRHYGRKRGRGCSSCFQLQVLRRPLRRVTKTDALGGGGRRIQHDIPHHPPPKKHSGGLILGASTSATRPAVRGRQQQGAEVGQRDAAPFCLRKRSASLQVLTSLVTASRSKGWVRPLSLPHRIWARHLSLRQRLGAERSGEGSGAGASGGGGALGGGLVSHSARRSRYAASMSAGLIVSCFTSPLSPPGWT